MGYQFKGKLCGYICSECPEALSGVKVRLYRTNAQRDVTTSAAAAPKDTFAILTEDEVKAKQSSLIAEVDTDANGQFVFNLDEKTYSGGAFEVDVYCGTAPHQIIKRKPPVPVQFSITTLQPMWRQTEKGFVAAWEYCISQRYWCLVRARLGAWTICGRVVTCADKIPIPGLTVTAFDADWLQDDKLGSAVTDANGKFRIDYLAEDFQKTPLSPWLNFELFGGPDVYFKVETSGHIVLINENATRARQADRENRGNCFCVELCVKDVPPNPHGEEIPPSFTSVGQYNIVTQIDNTTGLTVGDHRAFYSTLRLYGTVDKTLGGSQTEYMFEVAEYDPATDVLGAFTQVTPAQIARTVIGQRMIVLHAGDPGYDPMNPVQVTDWTVKGGAGELLATFSADGWVQVPQDIHFYPNTGSLPGLIRLDSNSLAPWGVVDQAGNHAGSSTTPPTLARDRHFQIRMWVRSATVAPQIAGTCVRIAIDNTLYDNVTHGGSWAPSNVSSQLGVAMLDVQELVGSGCGGIKNSLTLLYTAAHPNLGSVSVSMTGPGGPYAFTMTDNPAATSANRFGTAAPNGFVVANLQTCAYIVNLSVGLLLTTGDGGPDPLTDQLAFCKKP